jgi:hypothetical protein
MGWATFWAIFSRTHLVTLCLGYTWLCKILQRWRCTQLTIVGLTPEKGIGTENSFLCERKTLLAFTYFLAIVLHTLKNPLRSQSSIPEFNFCI